MNNSHWKPMPPIDFGMMPQEQQQQQHQSLRSITKNSNMFQNLPQQSNSLQNGFSMSNGSDSASFDQNSGGGMMASDSSVSPGFSNPSPRGNVGMSSSSSLGLLHRGIGVFESPSSSYGMGGSVSPMENESHLSPVHAMANGYGTHSSRLGSTRMNDFGQNGFDSGGGNGFHDGGNRHEFDPSISTVVGGGSSNAFDRSMSTNNFDTMMQSNGGGSYDRQISAPNLNGLMVNGSRMNNSSLSSPVMHRDYRQQNMFGGSSINQRGNSPPMFVGGNGGGGFKEMKIGTWNAESSGNNSNGFPSITNFEIGTFTSKSDQKTRGNQSDSSSRSSNTFHNQRGNNGQGGPGVRETGIIEKLLHSYGFIQCCDRQARLFFHFSQFDGNIEHLKIGDPVEFEMTYDRRTGKPIASIVTKIAPEVVLSEERVIGSVAAEAKLDPDTAQITPGRISYDNGGECYFLPFTLSDVEGNVTVLAGDKVSFQMVTMARSGNLVARTIRLENPSSPVKYQGVINSIKDNFGFIERADVVREIFFFFTELKDEATGEEVMPNLGDDVEFHIQTKNGKELACNIKVLPPGTVVFEDIGIEFFKGQVLQPLDKDNKHMTDAEVLNGRVRYRGVDRSEEEVPFGEKDQAGDFTLQHGDWVKFVIATDRRDKLKRATKIELMDETFNVSDERREQGKIQSLKEGFGFIKCAERDAQMFFRFSEILDVKRTLMVNDEVEFTVSMDSDQNQRQLATRIRHLDPGTVMFHVVIYPGVRGTVEKEPGTNTSWGNNLEQRDNEGEKDKNLAGKFLYNLNGLNLEIPVYSSDCDLRNFPLVGDVVQFDINQSKATKETNAVNVIVVERKAKPISTPTALVTKKPVEPVFKELHDQLGYVAAMKDGFGFLETVGHDKEIFFHFSNYNGSPEKLEVGMEVKYSVCNRGEKGGKLSAENVTIVERGSIQPYEALDEIHHGKVIRSLRSVNPDQDEYCGLIQVKEEEGKVVGEFEFSIASLKNKKELLQVGDPIQFQVSRRERNFALNIKSKKEKRRATVEDLKGQFGFLSYEVEEGKKLFFHMSEVENNNVLQQGEEVEFVLVTNKRTGKHSACCVKKISASKRPDHLISKLKAMNLEDAARAGKKVVVTRQPKGPESSKGFKLNRSDGE